MLQAEDSQKAGEARQRLKLGTLKYNAEQNYTTSVGKLKRLEYQSKGPTYPILKENFRSGEQLFFL